MSHYEYPDFEIQENDFVCLSCYEDYTKETGYSLSC